MGHWSRQKIAKNALLDYQAENNSSSLDGCPGLRAAMRDHKKKVWFSLAKAWVRRAVQQREGALVGWLVGVLSIVLWQRILGLIRA